MDRSDFDISDLDVGAKRISAKTDPDVWAVMLDPGGVLFLTVHVRDESGLRVVSTLERRYGDRAVIAERMDLMREARALVAEQVEMREAKRQRA